MVYTCICMPGLHIFFSIIEMCWMDLTWKKPILNICINKGKIYDSVSIGHWFVGV